MVLATRRKAAPPPLDLRQNASVSVVGYFYHVVFGPGYQGPLHRVGKDRRCCCPDGGRCIAVVAVADYLKTGGQRAPDPPPGYYPVAPSLCPICQAEAFFDPHLGSKRRGAGWRCSKTGSLHYWEAHVRMLRQKVQANPWLFPPVVVRQGVWMLAYDGIEPGDQVLSPGILREEVCT